MYGDLFCSDLILIGQLIVAILNLFVHIYNNKKK